MLLITISVVIPPRLVQARLALGDEPPAREDAADRVTTESGRHAHRIRQATDEAQGRVLRARGLDERDSRLSRSGYAADCISPWVSRGGVVGMLDERPAARRRSGGAPPWCYEHLCG